MPVYKAPLRDMQFVLREVMDFEKVRGLPSHEEVSDDLVDAIFDESAKYAENELFPINFTGDQEGCRLENGNVTTPKGFKEAYKLFSESGWSGMTADPSVGGQGLPEMIGSLLEEITCSANLSFGLYPGLTKGAYSLLNAHGSDELKDIYLEKLVTGQWAGTMHLTESQCGTDLGLIRTKAEPQENGTYKLTGEKIFISSGDHDMTENIIHLVLARTPDAPQGIKGISLFLVPKFMVNPDGSLGDRNPVTCAAIEHKMGIKASSTCVMTFDGAVGYQVGELNKGLSQMFTMMNAERLAVGNQGLGIGEVAYQNALQYARDRLQGRALTGAKFPDKAADPIIVHPDIRRKLLTMKAINEGNRMLATWVGAKLDISRKSDDAEERQEADDFIQLMTPIVKAFLTDWGFDSANLALQVFGGHGYVKEYGIEQFVRDARITQIYEGTNGIQALDLIGRKLGAHTGRYLRSFFHPVQEFIHKHQDDESLAEFIGPLAKVFDRLQRATLTVAQRGMANPDEAGAAAVDYLHLTAYTALAFLWAKAAKVALAKSSSADKVFYQGKVKTARFYMTKVLPKTSSLFASIMAGSKPLMTVEDEEFGPFDYAGSESIQSLAG